MESRGKRETVFEQSGGEGWRVEGGGGGDKGDVRRHGCCRPRASSCPHCTSRSSWARAASGCGPGKRQDVSGWTMGESPANRGMDMDLEGHRYGEEGTWMWMNSPRVGSSVKRCTPWPKVTTRSVALHIHTHAKPTRFQSPTSRSSGYMHVQNKRDPSWLNVRGTKAGPGPSPSIHAVAGDHQVCARAKDVVDAAGTTRPVSQQPTLQLPRPSGRTSNRVCTAPNAPTTL